MIELSFAPYSVTDKGEIYSYLKQRYLKPSKHSLGYLQVYLKHYDNTKRWHKIHRLVALLYMPNPDNKPCVDHIDNNRANNHKDNLQWVTHKENSQLSYTRDKRKIYKGFEHWGTGVKRSDNAKQLMSEAKKGNKHPKYKGGYTIDGIHYNSLQEAAIALNTYPMAIARLVKKQAKEASNKK